MDCLLSLSKASEALGTPSCRPQFVDGGGKAFVEFKNLRHPALELNMKGDFIANSVQLGEFNLSGPPYETTNFVAPQVVNIRTLL